MRALAYALACTTLLAALPALVCADDRASQDGALPSTPSQVGARLTRLRADEIERTLRRVPGVLTANVQLAGARDIGAPLDTPRRPVAAEVVLVAAPGFAVDGERIRAIVSSAVPDLLAQEVHVTVVPKTRTPEDGPPPLVDVGPFQVARGSAAALRWTLVTALAIDALLALGLIALLRRARRGERQPDQR